jgi:protein O-GlcNAc transferase
VCGNARLTIAQGVRATVATMTAAVLSSDLQALFARAQAAERAGDLVGMCAASEQAARDFPDHPGAWLVLGVARYRAGEGGAALQALRQAQALAPEAAEVNHKLGLIAYAHGDWPGATEALGRFAATPGTIDRSERVNALVLLANLLNETGRSAEAEQHARRAIALDPEHVDAQIALGAALSTQRSAEKQAESLAIMRQVLAQHPDNVTALMVVAAGYESARRSEQAYPFYAQVLTIQPDNARALARLLDVALTLCEWRRYDALVAGVLGRVRADIAAGKGLAFDVFNLLPLPVDRELLLAASRAQAARHAREAKPLPPLPSPRRDEADRRIRLGYLLPYTDRHSLPQALIGIIEGHDRAHFEVFGYSRRDCNGSAFSRQFRASFDHMADLAQARAPHGAETIRRDAIDILIDTTGHTGLNGLAILAHRPAAIQAHYLGYGLTSGAEFVDYLITDRTFLGPEGERHISEAPVFLPHSFMATMRAPIAVDRSSRAEEGLPAEGVVFANFNHPCKIDPSTFQLWLELLRAVPGSVLWLGDWTEGTRRRLRGVAAEQGVSPRRLVFAAIKPHPLHLARLALADIGLDNRLHGGGVTTVDALWAGLPVVSIAGALPQARLGATLLGAARLPELVTDTVDQYVELVLALARDPARRMALRHRLIDARDHAPLFDGQRYRRNLEQAYRLMWQRRCRGLAPGRIDVPDHGA